MRTPRQSERAYSGHRANRDRRRETVTDRRPLTSPLRWGSDFDPLRDPDRSVSQTRSAMVRLTQRATESSSQGAAAACAIWRTCAINAAPTGMSSRWRGSASFHCGSPGHQHWLRRINRLRCPESS